MLPNMRPVPWRPRPVEPMRDPPRRAPAASSSIPTTRLTRLLHRLLCACGLT